MRRVHRRERQGAGGRSPAGRARRGIAVAALAALASLAFGAPGAYAAGRIDLGAADSFAVLGATTVTSAGVSTLTGDLGVSPGTAVTGFGPGIGTVTDGAIHAGDTVAAQAHADLATAYAVSVLRTPGQPAVGALDGLTLGPGVYASGAALSLAGVLTLDAGGDPNAVFVLQAGSTLGTAAGSQVSLTGGAQACNVFWQVGSSATLGATSLLRGTILAHTSITVGAGVAIDGRALARDGAVTLDNDTVTVRPCAVGSLSNTAPAIAPFAATLTGVTRTVHAAVGAWSVVDTRGSGAGYLVTVSASAPTVGGSAAAAGTGAGLTLTSRSAVAAPGNSASPGPDPGSADAQPLGPIATTIASVAAGGGQGEWVFPADSGAEKSLGIAIPGDAAAGAFSSTLTFTTAPPVG
jgi:hypothetical protein